MDLRERQPLPPHPSSPSAPPPAVILPTIWRYLQILEAPPYFLGLGLSAFSLSGLLTGPLFGFWSDRSGATRSAVLLSNLFEIAGEWALFETQNRRVVCLCGATLAFKGRGLCGSKVKGLSSCVMS